MNRETILSEKLKEHHLNLHTLSEQSGVAYSTVYNLFMERKNIADAKVESLYRIARVLGLSMDALYGAFLPQQQLGNLSDFLLMWADEVIASVQVSDVDVSIRRFDLHPMKQIFYKEQMTRYELGEILRRRCWDEHRPDNAQLLAMIGLNEYNPYAICQKTHGRMAQDKTWFKFEGETINFQDLVRDNHAS